MNVANQIGSRAWRPGTPACAVTRCDAPLPNFNPSTQGQQGDTHNNGSNKSGHVSPESRALSVWLIGRKKSEQNCSLRQNLFLSVAGNPTKTRENTGVQKGTV